MITYTALDQSGNNATCTFTVEVIGKEKVSGDVFYDILLSQLGCLCEVATTKTNHWCLLPLFFIVINCTMLNVDLGNPLRVSNCGNNFGSKCNFSCAIGHRLNGSSTLTCVAPGNRPPGFWDNSTPVCQSGFGSI